MTFQYLLKIGFTSAPFNSQSQKCIHKTLKYQVFVVILQSETIQWVSLTQRNPHISDDYYPIKIPVSLPAEYHQKISSFYEISS